MSRIAMLAIVLLAALLFVATPAGAVSTAVDVDAGGPVPTSQTKGQSWFTFTVAGLGAIHDLNVRLAIQHGFTADLDILLQSPQGTWLPLLSDVGDGEDFQDTLLDDEAPQSIIGQNAHNPFRGSYRPEDTLLSRVDGENPNGVWQLLVIDDSWGDSGWLYRANDSSNWNYNHIGTQLIFETPSAVIPEPTCLATAGLAATALLGYLRRRRA